MCQQQRIARQADNTLDVEFVWFASAKRIWEREDDHITTAHIAQEIRDLAHEDVVAMENCAFHGVRRDRKRAKYEHAQRNRNTRSEYCSEGEIAPANA